MAWSPDTRRLAAATNGGEIQIWDASRGYQFSRQGGRQGELAWCYYQESPQQDSPAMKRARWREVLELAPDTLEFWELRGNASARLGDFDRATMEFAKAIAPGLRRSFVLAKCYGDALLGTGNQEAYVGHCVSMLDAFADTHVPSNGGHVAWVCALVQDSRIDAETVLGLAQKHAEANAGDGGDQAMLCLGAAFYRSGRYDEATSVLTKLAAKIESSGDPGSHGDMACALNFLAMTRHQLGHASQARRYINDAAKWTARALPDLDWTMKVQLGVLNREARALVGI